MSKRGGGWMQDGMNLVRLAGSFGRMKKLNMIASENQNFWKEDAID